MLVILLFQSSTHPRLSDPSAALNKTVSDVLNLVSANPEVKKQVKVVYKYLLLCSPDYLYRIFSLKWYKEIIKKNILIYSISLYIY